MAHGLFKDGMAFVGDEPWHGLGKAMPEAVSAKIMCEAAGLDWSVWKAPAPGARLIDARNEVYDRYLVLRDHVKDERSPVALGMVSGGYELLQNTEAFAFFEPFIDSGFAAFHTAGALGNGERVWVMAKLTENMVIGKDDAVARYLLLSNTHDGSGSVSVRFTPIRVVCQNTLSFAMARSSGVISIRHTRYLAKHLAKAQASELKLIIDKAFAEAETLFGGMALKKMSVKNIDDFLELLFPLTEKQRKEKVEPERWLRIKAILDDARVTPRQTRQTLWALYNAIVRDEDYRLSPKTGPESRLNRIWFGSGNDLKLKALAASRDLLEKAA